jgi:hypothetical protein
VSFDLRPAQLLAKGPEQFKQALFIPFNKLAVVNHVGGEDSSKGTFHCNCAIDAQCFVNPRV